jgi:ribonuclease HI
MSSGTSDSLPHVELFTDGACSGNPGPGGWAFILRDMKSGREVERSGGERRTTNNRMELTAVIEGLAALKGPSRVDLYSDSQYIVNGLNSWMDGWKAKGWRRGRNQPLLNPELWQRLDGLRQIHEINPVWVRGHSEHPENERCDTLAVAAIKQFQQ